MAQESVNSGATGENPTAVFFRFGHYEVDSQSLTLSYRGALLPLAPKVVKTLVALVQRAGHVVSKEELLAAVWSESSVEEANLSQNIYTLRRTFESTSNQQFIETLSRRRR